MFKLIHNSQILEIFLTEQDAKNYLVNFLLAQFVIDDEIKFDLNGLNEYNNLIKEKKYDEFIALIRLKNKNRYKYKLDCSIEKVIPLSKVIVKRPKGMIKKLDRANKEMVFK